MKKSEFEFNEGETRMFADISRYFVIKFLSFNLISRPLYIWMGYHLRCIYLYYCIVECIMYTRL